MFLSSLCICLRLSLFSVSVSLFYTSIGFFFLIFFDVFLFIGSTRISSCLFVIHPFLTSFLSFSFFVSLFLFYLFPFPLFSALVVSVSIYFISRFLCVHQVMDTARIEKENCTRDSGVRSKRGLGRGGGSDMDMCVGETWWVLTECIYLED
jgi:hypothetical protein